jgi:hypothetical protein
MKRLEEDLGKAFERMEPPAGFAERVMARVAAAEHDKRRTPWTWLGLFQTPALRWAATGALCVALTAGGISLRREQVRRERGEYAKEQLMLALRITGSKLQVAQASVREISDEN